LKQPNTSHLTADCVVCAATVPPGYVLVPIEPTTEMLNAALKDADDTNYYATRGYVDEDIYRDGWKAMLAALPPAPGSADNDSPRSDHPLSMSMFASKADYEEAKDRFCDNNCTWRDHHPECPHGIRRREDCARCALRTLEDAEAKAPLPPARVQAYADRNGLPPDSNCAARSALLARKGIAMADLKPCPFCGGTPSTIERPDNIDGTEFFYAVSCYCGGYSACAHKMAKCKTPEQAKADAIAAWNTRASDGVKGDGNAA
jgi:Lar family restriction alleviation protein